MLLHTQYRNLIDKVRVLNEYRNKIEDQTIKEEIAYLYQSINDSYIDFVRKHPDVYFKEYNGSIQKTIISYKEQLNILCGKAISKSMGEEEGKLRMQMEQDQKYGLERLKKYSLIIGFVSIALFLIHVFVNQYSWYHPFSLLLIGLMLPSLTILIPNKLAHFIVGFAGLGMSLYSAVNLPTNDSLELTDSISHMTGMPTTVLGKYRCKDKCVDYNSHELFLLKDALLQESKKILEKRRTEK